MTTPQWNAGTTFHPVQATNSASFPGYGVYSPAYLESLALLPDLNQDEPYLFPDLAPENLAPEGGEDPFQNVHTVEPVDNVETDDNAAAEAAEGIVDDVSSGKSLELIAEEQGLSRQELVEKLEAAGLEVETTEPEGETGRTTVITDPETNDTLAEYEEVELANGGAVETFTNEDGDTVRVVIDDEGNRTILEEGQETTREGIDGIAEDVSEGKGLDQIAEERGLTREQVIAQLAAAGYAVEFETNELANGGEQYTTRIVDAEDGEEVIASYSSGRGTGTSSVYIDAEGNEVNRTEYGNGTVIETVIDADGRETKTTTVAENNGEAIEYEVQDGDYLIAIAERYGVTLEELEESNPELFDSPRDPNVIHEGETVIIEGATQTTVEVTDNGYTLTTSPDGSMTLRRDEDGLEVDIEPATQEESLTELLMGLDGDSDEEQALQGILESILLGSEELARIEELEDELAGLEEETQAAIDEILGDEGDADEVIKPASDAAGDNPGTPPDEAAPSGGEWEAVRRNGVWVWVDAELVEVVEAEEAARRARDEAMTSVLQRQAELDVYALDPEHEEAWNNALERLNAAGEAHGVYWELPDPDSALEEAQERLEEITTWIEYLDAEREWQELQEEAEDIEERLVKLYEEDEEYARYFDEDGYEYTVSRGRAGSKTEHTGELENQEIIERDGQLYLVNTYENMDEEVEVPLTYAPGDAPRERPDRARGLDREWDELMRGGDSLELADIKQDALAAEREENPHYFEEGGYEYEVTSRGRGGRSTRDRHTGELMAQSVIERDGQLWLVNTYASEEVEIQLTYAPGESGRTDAQQQVDGDWAHWKRERNASADGLVDVTERYNEAKEDYQEMRAEQFAEQRESLEGENGEIANAQQTLDDAEERLGEGSLVSDGEDTVPIERDGETWYVHPEVAAAHEVLNDAEERLAEYSRLEEAALEAYRERHPERFGDNYRYYDASRDPRGEGRMQSAGRFSENDVTVTVEDGQLHLTIVYENYTLEDELTYTPDEAPEWMERTEAEQQLDRQWADWIAEGSLEEARTAVAEAQTSYDDTVEEYGLGGTEKLTGSLPDDVDPVLVPIINEEMGEGMRWVHPEVAAAQEELALLEEQRDSLEAGEWHARMEAYRAAQPSTWQLLDGGTSAGPAQEGPGPAESWQWEDDYLELEGGYLEAQQHLSNSRETRILTQLGIMRAGISFMEKAPEDWKEQHPELNLADELDLLEKEAKVLGEALDENADYRLNIERASRFNAHLLEQEEAHRLDPDNSPEIVTAFRDQEADEARVEAGLDNLPEERVITIDEELDENLSAVLGTDDAELIDPVADQIRELGDKGDEVEIIPILYQESGSTYDTALFRMGEDDTHPWLIDDSGSRYRNFADFQYNNYLSEDGQVYVPENFAEIADISGDIQYEWQQAREKSFTEEWLDPVIGIGTGVATLLSFTPAAPIAAPLAYAGGAYFAARSIDNLANMKRHGRSWASAEGLMQGAMLATSVLPMASSGLRFAGMTARGVEGTVAARTSIGAFNARRLNPTHPHYSPNYAYASQMLSQPGGVFAAARWSDVGAMGIGAPLLGHSGYNLVMHWDEMSGLELTEAVTGVASGTFGTGMGYLGLRASWPNQGGAREQAPPTLPQGEGISASYQNNHDTGARKSSLTRFRDFMWDFVQQNPVRGDDRGIFRIPFWSKKENQGAAAIREEQGLPPWVNDADVQAAAALKSLSPEEIAALSGKERLNIEPWHLLLLSPEQLKAWPDPPNPTRKLSFDEWHERSRLVLLKNTAMALLEPTVIRPRLAGLMGEVTPSHTEATAVFRGDTRGPDVIFLPGFQPRNPSDPHGGVSTSLSARKARWWASERASDSDTWVYTIISDVSDGEIFQSLPARPKNKTTPQREADINNYEVRFSQGIAGQDILSARRVDSEGNYVGPPVYNPGFKDPARLPAYLSAEALQGSQAVRGVDPKTERDLTAQFPAHDHFTPRVLGHPPKDVSNIYIQPDIGPRPRGDEAGVQHKTHILYRDPETGEAFVMPWMRGASPNHVPGTQQTATPPQGLARLYRLGDLDALNQASSDGTLPADHYVHIVRSSNTGLDDATYFIDGGTVPKSGRIDENGHLRWPSSQKGQPVTLSLHDQGNGRQTVRIEDATGSGASPREVTAKNGDIFIVVSSDRVTETRAQIQGGGLPFAVYSGNGLWSVSSTVSAGQPSTATPNAAPNARQQGTTPPQTAHRTQQNATPSQSTPASGRVSVSGGPQGPVVQIHGLGDGWTSVVGESSRKIWHSPYDRKAKKQALPETTLVRRSVLEQALAPEDVAKLPNGPYVRVSLVAGSHGSGQVHATPAHATGNDSSPARRRTARGLATALVGGSLFGGHSAAAHGWTGDVLNRAASPESPALLLNGLGFVTRGTLNFFKARFDEKIRINHEALERGEVTAELLNWEASRIIASRRALNLSKEQVARIGTVTEEFWARYQLLQELHVNQASAQRGWTEDARMLALRQSASLYREQLKRVAGAEALTVNPLDPRTVRGVIFNSSILATHLVNDVVSWQYLQNQWSNGELFSTNLLDVTGNLGLAGFLAANVVLAGSAAVKVGTGLARVDLKSLPLINKLTGTSTATGSYFYGIMTPPWAAYTMYSAGDAIANGHWFAAGVHLAALPFQIGLSYYGIKGLRDDAISMVQAWKGGQDPSRSWPIRLLYPMTTIPMAALTGTEAYNQFMQGNHLAGTALAGGTLMQMYFIDLASRRLNWRDADVRHGPFRRLTDDNRLAADGNRIWAGVGLTLAGGMLIPGALIDLRDYLEDKELLPDWEWLIADLEDDEESGDSPATEDVSGRSEQEFTSLSPEPTQQPNDGGGRHEEEHEHWSARSWRPSTHTADIQRRTNPALEDQGHDWVEVESHLSLGGIAISRGHDVAEVVELNLGHIADPSALQPGDRVYLPKREMA
ncbi:LysM peptidoglycan-binding domain-containing protein [Billgrantia sulfidoxydans]|uniref:LysM peptidoglycan-binding domain-containing protein n=1 Tax=Billgrantia sulfidoxydans TaxID=2733484 RepID=A0ABX7W0E3_9GAMM|nr:LysM domain-containing protein [Halomonas sulfidoxydans]QTP53916.1 LysM peptidoglycan-binding domain-containing protein [Halomonas sulfidoxydans]